jgi:CubicO group peptidase (beta-lactamase class C family)
MLQFDSDPRIDMKTQFAVSLSGLALVLAAGCTAAQTVPAYAVALEGDRNRVETRNVSNDVLDDGTDNRLSPERQHLQSGAAVERDSLTQRLDSIARAAVDERGLAGLSVALVQGPDTLLFAEYGFADLEHMVRTPRDAVYEISSITKQFTAAAVLQLVDEGRLGLDEDARRFLPMFPPEWPTISVRQLLDNTSGMPEVARLPGYIEIRTQRLPRDTLLDIIFAEPRHFDPGEAASYTSSGFILAGHLIETVTGSSYEEYVGQRLFEPLGMASSRYCSDLELIPNRAREYRAVDEGLRNAIYTDHTWPWAAGSLCSTTGDLLRWLRALHGGEVVSPESYEQMMNPSLLANGGNPRYGLGTVVAEDRNGYAYLGHSGGGPGFASEARFYPAAELAVVVLTNTGGLPGIAGDLAERLAVEALGGPAPRTAAPPPADLDFFAGTYEGSSPDGPLRIIIERRGDELFGGREVSELTPLRYIGNDTFTFGRGEWRLTFRRDGDGGPVLLVSPEPAELYVLKRTVSSSQTGEPAAQAAAADSVVRWPASTATRIDTVEPASVLTDLELLRHVVGDARIVALGEPTHGNREVFQLKHRMIHFLVTRMGFNIFALESPMAETFDLNAYVLTGRGDPAKALAGIYYWTWDTEEVLAVIEWIREYTGAG